MRKLGLLVVCGVALCGPAWAASRAGDEYAAMTAYARRFDNAYLAASHGRRPADAPPYDAALIAPAQDSHDKALSQCLSRQAEYQSNRAWMECFLDADNEFVAAVTLRDTLLVDTFAAAIRRAADDADAGKLTADQLASVYLVVSAAYAAIIEDEYATWRKAHPQAQ